MAAPLYSITLHHLSPDAKIAGLSYADEHLLGVSAAQMRELLYALAEVASRQTIYEPATPEIRVKTDRDVFIVRTRYRRLCFVGWEPVLRGEDHSVEYILAAITGGGDFLKAAPTIVRPVANYTSTHSAPALESGGAPRWLKVTLMTLLIVGFNAAGLWMLLKPAPTLAPKFTLLPDFESRALLTKTAGEYLTGSKEGDRRLIIELDGTLRLAKFGARRALIEERTKSARGGLVNGRAALITSEPNVLSINDVDTVVLYGNTYRRHTR